MKNLPNQQFRQDVHSHNTRNRRLIDVPFHRLTKSLKSYEVTGPKCYNKFSITVFNCSLEVFKQKLHNWLTEHPFYSLDEFFEFSSEPIKF